MTTTEKQNTPVLAVLERRRQEEAERKAQIEARRKAKAEHDAQFITVQKLSERFRCSDRFEVRAVVFETLRGDRTPLFCLLLTGHEAEQPSSIKTEDTRWTPLPPVPVVSRYRNPFNPFITDGQCYTLLASPEDSPNSDPLASALGRHTPFYEACRAGREPPSGFSMGALAIRVEDAARLFGPEIVAEPVPVAPSAVAVVPDSASAPASTPEPVAGTAGAGDHPGGAAVRHRAASRRQPLAAVFARAKDEATDRTCPHSVWASLVALATGKNPPRELTDFDEEKGIQATGTRSGWLTKAAFMERWRKGNV